MPLLLRPLPLLLLLASTSASAGPGEILYGTGPLEPAKLLKSSDAELAKQIVTYTKFYKLTQVDKLGEGDAATAVWSATDASTDALAGMSRAEKIAVLSVLQRKPIGVEADILVFQSDAEQTPVTVYWDAPTRVTYRAGAAITSLFQEGITAETIRAKFGVGEFTEGDAKWDPVAFFAVDQALATLNKEELLLVKDVPFRRMKVSAKHRATYHRGEAGIAVNVFDAAFLFDKEMFMGLPSAPRADSVGVIVHELGHAIADVRAREFAWQSKVLAEDYRKKTKETDELAAAYNAKATLPGAAKDPKIVAELKAIDADLTQAKKDTEARFTEANGRVLLLNGTDTRTRSSGGRAAEAALTAVLKHKDAPTTYGKTSPSECFAESFRLFRVDPDALKRIAPKASEWFQAGNHTTVAMLPLKQ